MSLPTVLTWSDPRGRGHHQTFATRDAALLHLIDLGDAWVDAYLSPAPLAPLDTRPLAEGYDPGPMIVRHPFGPKKDPAA